MDSQFDTPSRLPEHLLQFVISEAIRDNANYPSPSPTMISSLSSHTVLLVDGYNIIGAWPKLRKLARQDAMDLARLKLIEYLASYVAYRGYQTLAVFDAYTQLTPAKQEVSPSGIELYYTSYGETADTVIERTCAQLRWEDCRVRVATSDRAEQLVVSGYDAEWLSAKQLWDEIKQTQEQIKGIKLRPSAVKVERGIHGHLDATTFDLLNSWRKTGIDPRYQNT